MIIISLISELEYMHFASFQIFSEFKYNILIIIGQIIKGKILISFINNTFSWDLCIHAYNIKFRCVIYQMKHFMRFSMQVVRKGNYTFEYCAVCRYLSLTHIFIHRYKTR